MADYSVTIEGKLIGFNDIDKYEQKIRSLQNLAKKGVTIKFEGSDALSKSITNMENILYNISTSGISKQYSNAGKTAGNAFRTALQEQIDTVAKTQQTALGYRVDDTTKNSFWWRQQLKKGTSLSDSEKSAYSAFNNFYQKENNRMNSSGFIASDKYKSAMADYSNAIKQLQSARHALETSENPTFADKNKYKEAAEACKQYATVIKDLSSAEKGLSNVQQSKISGMLSELEGYTAMSNASKAQLQQYKDLATSGKYYNSTDMIANLKTFKAELVSTGQARKSFWDTFKEKSWYTTAQKFASMFTIWDGVRYAKQIASVSTEINSAFTELSKVSDVNLDTLNGKLNEFASTAKDVGATISDTINATSDWSRMGYSLPDSQELAKVSLIYKNVGDGISVEDANNSLISTLKGYNLEASDAMSVVDKFNEVSNNFAIDSGGIGEALQRSAASFNAANTDLSKSIALITGTRWYKLVQYMETYIKNIFNCHRILYYYTPQYRGNYCMTV